MKRAGFCHCHWQFSSMSSRERKLIAESRTIAARGWSWFSGRTV
jgi:hypothetical protein